MKNLAPLISLILTIIILRLLQPVLRKFFDRPGAQERRLAKAKLPLWLKVLEFFLFIGFLMVTIILVIPRLISSKSGNITSVFDAIEILLVLITAVPIAGLLCNLVLWIIPPARKVTEENAKGIPGLSFQDANLGLIKFTSALLILWVIFIIFRFSLPN